MESKQYATKQKITEKNKEEVLKYLEMKWKGKHNDLKNLWNEAEAVLIGMFSDTHLPQEIKKSQTV